MSNVKRLTMLGITKEYPGCKANDDVFLEIEHGEIHALLGENGAGKSTLMKMLYGVVKPDAGTIMWNGKEVSIEQPATARSLGIGMVFQHFSLFETLTVTENIALVLGDQAGHPNTLAARIKKISERYGMPLDPDRRVSSLSTGERQRVEIVRCLLLELQLLILDEPTSVLTPQEVEQLFKTLKQLTKEGCSILFISHKLHEVTELCDSATILRAGKVTGHCNPKNESSESIARMMVGDDIAISNECRRAVGGEVFVDIENLSTPALSQFDVALKQINLQVKKGEIVGIAGIAGNGQDELFKALSGEEIHRHSKAIKFSGDFVDHLSPLARRRLGMAFVPEDRLGRGAVPELDLRDNALLTSFDSDLVKNGFLNKSNITQLADHIIEKYKVKTAGNHDAAESLSGGNLQKFIVGREVEQEPLFLLMSHPTWGVDIGAQVAIHQAILELRDRGCAILIVSEDLDELYKVCDRLGAICDGELSAFLEPEALPLVKLGQWMAGDFDSTSVLPNTVENKQGVLAND
tara:strand:+ start:5495 stop:7060 length:1566 start_codon:yes stop_codon:yes gene_type:complete